MFSVLFGTHTQPTGHHRQLSVRRSLQLAPLAFDPIVDRLLLQLAQFDSIRVTNGEQDHHVVNDAQDQSQCAKNVPDYRLLVLFVSGLLSQIIVALVLINELPQLSLVKFGLPCFSELGAVDRVKKVVKVDWVLLKRVEAAPVNTVKYQLAAPGLHPLQVRALIDI